MNNNDNGSQSSLYHVTEDRSSKLRHLVQPAGTVPFAGLRTPVSYPDEIDEDLEDTPRFNTENVSSFVEAIEVLPEAHKVQTFAENMFVEEGEDGTPEVDLEAALNVDGLDYDQIEDVEGNHSKSWSKKQTPNLSTSSQVGKSSRTNGVKPFD